MDKIIKKIIPIFSLLLSFVMLNNDCKSQTQSNMQILDSLIALSTNNICRILNSKAINEAIVKFSNNSSTWLIKQNLLKSAENNHLKFYTKQPNKNLTVVEINIKECSIEYKPIETTNDSLKRLGNINLLGIITNIDGSMTKIKSNKYSYQDKVSRNNLVYINNSDYKFLNPKVPDKTIKFWEKIAEPLIVVSSAILVVILFFTVRSG